VKKAALADKPNECAVVSGQSSVAGQIPKAQTPSAKEIPSIKFQTTLRRLWKMTKSESRMSKECRSIIDQEIVDARGVAASDFRFLSSFGICHSSFTRHVSRFNDLTVQRFSGYHS